MYVRHARWSVELEKNHTYRPTDEIIREHEISTALEETKMLAKDAECVRNILTKARENALLVKSQPATTNAPVAQTTSSEYVQGLSVRDAAVLLNLDENDASVMQPLFHTALAIKERIYGNRIVLFAPLYLASYCVNQCTYCAFRASNKSQTRGVLTREQLIAEVEALQQQGHRRLLLVAGESPKYSFEQVLDAIKTTAAVKTAPCGSIRRINVEIPALSVSDFKRLKATDCVGTYTLFQETYHRDTFKRVHPFGPKANYDHRLLTMDRAQRGGVDDVGIGALFGLADYRFEVLAMLQHAQHLEDEYNAGPHTISIPRIQPAVGAPDSAHGGPTPVSDAQFAKLVAVLRCAVPYTGMILSTRESPEMRRKLLQLGVSQMSAGSRTDLGAYEKMRQQLQREQVEQRENGDACKAESKDMLAQFTLQDHRGVDEVVRELLEDGFVPSWCTACYRKGRTGAAFMAIAKRGDIHNYCHPNGLLTLKEYLEDYAGHDTKSIGEEVMKREEQTITSRRARNAYERKLNRVGSGERDLYF